MLFYMYFKLGILFIVVNHAICRGTNVSSSFGLIECILETETCRYMHIADRRPGFIASPTYIINKYFYFLSVRKHTCFIVLTQQCGPSNSAQFCGILHIFSLYGRMSV